MPQNPSRFLVREFDLKTPLREWCTCPKCLVVWTHRETMDHGADWTWAKERYSGPTRCSECGTISAAVTQEQRRSSPRNLRNEDRVIVTNLSGATSVTDVPTLVGSELRGALELVEEREP